MGACIQKGVTPDELSDIDLTLNLYDSESCSIADILKTTGISKAMLYSYLKKRCNLSAAEGQNSMQIINSIQAGNTGILSKLADCCCENRLAIANQTNALQNAINGTNVGMERGFSSVAYAAQQQTCDLKQNADCNTRSILAKLDQIEDSRKDREINNLTAQLTAANSRAERQSELAPIYKALNDIQCKQPTTVTTPYQPFVTVPNCVAWQYGLNGFNGFGNNGGGFL
ncbi:MAG: hypothetical protein MJZ98_07300 [Paludibacteraceae bacterium]|nr:hypothetical protein [Paludibacteraceae bacterium]